MKKLLFVLVFSFVSAWMCEQSIAQNSVPLIGSKAPSFEARSTNGLIHFPKDFGSKWKIILSHPRDFTPVCTSEIFELAQMQKDFDRLNVALIIVSTDTLDKHYQWKKMIENLTYKNRQGVEIQFPLIDDKQMIVSKLYGMLHNPTSTTKDVRGVFIINPENVIESVAFYPMNIGRNMEEIRRTIVALESTHGKSEKLLTPANWVEGQDLLVGQFPYTQTQLQSDPSIEANYYSVGSFMWFKKSPLAVLDDDLYKP